MGEQALIGDGNAAASKPDEVAAAAEELHRRELLLELGQQPGDQNMDGLADNVKATPQSTSTRSIDGAAEAPMSEEAMAAVMLPRKKRNLYQSIQRAQGAKRARVEQLIRKKAALADSLQQ